MDSSVKTKLTTAYMMFIFEFADPSSLSREELEAKMPCLVKDLFSAQKNCDRARKTLKDDIKKAIALYLSEFQSQDGFRALDLEQAIRLNKKNMVRHLGKDKMNYLCLLVDLMKTLGPKKGLLAA